MRLTNFTYILWDFDGVIIDSNPARVLGFESVLSEFPKKEVEQLLEFHSQNGGLSRYVKFRYLYEQIRNESVSDDRINELASNFSRIMKDILCKPELLIEDTVDFIRSVPKKIKMHIVSGSDGEELRYLCSKLEIDSYFEIISGSPTPKTELVKNLIFAKKIDPRQSCLIGDAGNDFDAAYRNGIVFFGYNNPSIKHLGNGYIEKLNLWGKSQIVNIREV